MLKIRIRGSRPTRAALVALLAVPVLLLAGSGHDFGAQSAHATTVPGTSAPEAAVPAPAPEASTTETTPTETTTEAEESGDDSSSVSVWVFVVIGLVLVGVIAWFGARSGSRRKTDSQQRAGVADWQSGARTAYAESRWLYDELDAPLAIWRGDSLYEAQKPGGGTPDTAKQAIWSQLPARMNAARESLYRVEANAPSSDVAQLASNLNSSLVATQGAVDRLAEARRARRAIDDDPSQATAALERARSEEMQATDALASDRQRLSDATIRFSSAT